MRAGEQQDAADAEDRAHDRTGGQSRRIPRAAPQEYSAWVRPASSTATATTATASVFHWRPGRRGEHP
ncbi:hypothetical protein SAMN05660642_01708 [Geodermatophilus siccatus]|uniref:Uncharacterized protein n=1 Tax=Geodermatophilus siccatus TaxID=1137991 RepID=A0A1G9QLZ8_9ACTN|nr:hypothetical protein SAMN05660642_01708 [Geodermatophilus siccatus]